MKFRGSRRVLRSPKSKVITLVVLIIILIVVALAAIFLLFEDKGLVGQLICRRNVFLSTSSPYRFIKSRPVDNFLTNKKPTPTKKPVKGIYGDQKVPILTWHYIESMPPFTSLPNLYEDFDVFENQLLVLRDNSYNTIFVRDLGSALYRRKPISSNSIILTFDDGYEDFYTAVFPLMKKYNMRATLYVIVDFVDKPGYVTSAQIKEMAHSGYIEIGSHTMSHINLRKASDSDAYYQIFQSKKKLSEIIGLPVDDFAYPFGFFTSRDVNIARSVGYLTAASTYQGTMQTYGGRFSLFRLKPSDRMNKEFLDWLHQQLK